MEKGKYSEDDKKIMKIAKDSLNKSRIQELINFVKNSGFKKIGIANCFSMQEYADKVIKILEENGFEVVSINCKKTKLKHKDLFETENDGLSCDPKSQADYLNLNKTDFNINIGLCLGHGILFDKYSSVPTTTLIVKDFSTNHKTITELEE